MTCNFSLQHYADCLRSIKVGEDVEILHDLDHAESNILEIAEIEQKNGLTAKYFIRIHAKNYNPFSLPNLQVYRKLLDMGHDVGLHFEPAFYTKETVTAAIAKEADFLGSVIGTTIKYVSIHEPARFGSVPETLIPKNLTYYCWDSSYYKDKKYISDSSARWREGCMCQHIGKHEKLIVLTHPIWWYHQTSAENY